MPNTLHKFSGSKKAAILGDYTASALNESFLSKPIILTEKLQSLSAAMPAAAIANVMVGAIVVWLLSGVGSLYPLLIWFALLFISQIYRFSFFVIVKNKVAYFSSSTLLSLFRLSALCSGAVWAGLSVFLFPPEIEYQVFLSFVVSGVTGAALGGLASDRVSVLLLCIPALLPLSIRFLMGPDELSLSMGALGLLYISYIVVTSIGGERSFTNMIQLKEKAEAGSRIKSAFLANVSHEIRTPLNAICGLVELLGEEKSAQEYKNIVQLMNQSVASLTGVIDDVLYLSKIESNSLELQPEPIQIFKLIDNTVESFRANATDSGLYLEHVCEDSVPEWLSCDPTRLRQVIFNLIDNSIKFTKQGGVSIRTSLSKRTASTVGIVISVIDTGVGISIDAQRKLFQPFASSEFEDNNIYGGAGLGLSISKRLFELMGGNLTLQSEVGRGTIVTLNIVLPVSGERLADGSASLSSASKSGESKQTTLAPRKILLVDDNAINRLVLSRQLRVLGYPNDQAVDGRDAIEKQDNYEYAMIIADCHMPFIDGYKMTRIIRERESRSGKNRRMPIIGYTANAMHQSRTLCLDAGMNDLFIKPVTLEELRVKIERYLLSDAYFSPSSSPGEVGVRSEESGKIIDWRVLDSITGNDQEFVREILNDFILDKSDEAKFLVSILDEGDMQEVQRVAHRLKGAAKTIAAVPLYTVCEKIELGASTGDRKLVSANKADLNREFIRLKACIEENEERYVNSEP